MNSGPDLDRVREFMKKIASHDFGDTEVGTVLDYALDTTGKMIRARLLLASADFGPDRDNKKDRLCMLAAMVELIHLASLIHDDIVDESDFRRGKPSMQSKYHKDSAVYAGDFLITRVNYTLAKNYMNESSMALSKTIEKMCAGEIDQGLCRYKTDTSIQQYMNTIKGKTAELFKSACMIGAVEAGAAMDTVNMLANIGETLGIMFQLRDDLLDYSESALIGKASHIDFREGIYTMPVLYALQNDADGKLMNVCLKNAQESLTSDEIKEVEKLVVELGGVEQTKQEIKHCRTIIDGLLAVLPEAPSKDLLSELTAKLSA